MRGPGAHTDGRMNPVGSYLADLYAVSGVVMPGSGEVRSGTCGEGFVDVHLHATTRRKAVPEAVWNYTLGGYQVLKKWLSYREAALLALDSHYRASATPAFGEPSSPRAGTRKR